MSETAAPGLFPAGAEPGVLANASFRRLWMASVLSLAGSQASRMAILLFLFKDTGRVADLAWLVALGTLPGALVAPLGGVAADRLDRRAVMVAADVARAALVLAVLAYPVPAVIYPAVVLISVGSALFDPARAAAIPSVVGREGLTHANAMDQGASNVMMVAGPMLGAELFVRFGLRGALAVDAATFIASALLILGVRMRSAPPRPARTASPLADVAEGVRYLRGNSLAQHLLALSFLSLLCVGLWMPLAPFYLQALGAPERVMGVQMGVFGVGGLAGAVFAPRLARRMGKGRLLLVSLAGEAVCMVAYSAATTPRLSTLVLVPWGVAVSGIGVAFVSLLQERVEERCLGRVFAVSRQAESVALLVSLGAAVAMARLMSPAQAFALAGAAYLATTAAVALSRGGRELARCA